MPGRKLIQLVYQSRATAALGSFDMAQIRSVSTARNRELCLTGVLIRFGDRFVGVLEGRKSVVLHLMERIAVDPRHENLEAVREAMIDERRFGDWRIFELPPADGDGETLCEAGILFARKLSRDLYRET